MSTVGRTAIKVVVSVGAAALVSMSVVGFLQRGGGEDVSAAAGPNAAGAVTIIEFAFEPATMTVPVGQTVTWTNEDKAAHTVTSTDAGPLASGDLAQGAKYEKTFDAAGSYPYKCTIHPYMTGTVEVSE